MVKLPNHNKKNVTLKVNYNLKKKLKKPLILKSEFLNKLKNMFLLRLGSRKLTYIIIAASLLLGVFIGLTERRNISELSGVLIYTKSSCEEQFVGILEEIEDNPLNDLIGDNLPTVEEIFFAEWSNDWFPRMDIPIVGSIIEEFGAQKVGNLDFDGRAPYADLNITIFSSPSNLSLQQCQALWNQKDPYSFLVRWPDIWYSAIDGNQESINRLRVHFNLTYGQFDLISTWINTSSTSWISTIAASGVLDIPVFSTLIALGIMAMGVFVCALIYQRRNEILDSVDKRLEKRRVAKKRKTEQKRVEEEKKKKETAKLEDQKILPPKTPISSVKPQAPKSTVPTTAKNIPQPFKSSVPQERPNLTLLNCPECGGQRIVYYIKTKVSSNSAVLKVNCPVDKQNLVVTLPLDQIDQWLTEVADQIYRCRICGQQIPTPEKIVSKEPWVVLYMNCPTHGRKAPKRYIPSRLYPRIQEAFEKRNAPSGESKSNNSGGNEN